MKYTAEEVRARFEAWLIREHECAPEDLIWQEKRNCYADYATHLAWNAYRDAYADPLERIKADESAAPVGFVMEATATRHKFGLLTQDLPPGAELFTHPPAQAAAQGGVTDGWVLVPVEPTEAMQTAHHIYGDTSDWWGAVIAAVPSAPEAASYCDASQERCKACGRATRAVCDGLDGNGLGCTNAPPINLAAVREVIAEIRRCAGNNNAKFHLTWADKLEAALAAQESNHGSI